jgi:hypothetical protein
MRILYARSNPRQTQTAGRQSAAVTEAFEEVSVISFKDTQAGVEEFALGNDYHVEPRRYLVSTKNLSNQSFSSVSLNRAADLPGCRDPEPSYSPLIRQNEDGGVAAMDSNTPFVDLLKLKTPTNVFGWTESQSYSLLTVRRLRPLARRRFSTRRPFFVLIRTRNPCVFVRWRVLG